MAQCLRPVADLGFHLPRHAIYVRYSYSQYRHMLLFFIFIILFFYFIFFFFFKFHVRLLKLNLVIDCSCDTTSRCRFIRFCELKKKTGNCAHCVMYLLPPAVFSI